MNYVVWLKIPNFVESPKHISHLISHMNTKKLLLGDEAFALGAIEAGLSGAYAYPGTPSTEILEFVQSNPIARERGIHSHWSSNEKTAMEEALGMSYCGKRAIVSMKHVGLNVAADPFVNAAMTGANGGLLVVAADDPSMHSSQNEQDSRFYANFAIMPVLEPSNQQEAYDMAAYGFELSEKLRIPVLVRFVTRLSHSRSTVVTKEEPAAENALRYPENPRQWVLMPGNSKVRYRQLLKDRVEMEALAAASPFNSLVEGSDRRLGVIASGIGYNYVQETFGGKCPFSLLKISQYPVPRDLVKTLAESCEAIFVVEEGQPMIEDSLRGLLDCGPKIYGKRDSILPTDGELTPDTVAAAFVRLAPDSGAKLPDTPAAASNVVARPPALCQGCGHRDVYGALNAALAEFESPKVFGDIGCYTLGFLSPFNALDTTVDMGASITMAKGAADAGQHPAVAIIGDSTFTHSGMTGLLDAVNEDSPITVIISDNLTTGMTGGQDSQGTGKIEDICLGLGVKPERLHTIDAHPRKAGELKALFESELAFKGLSVIVARRECIQTARRHAKK